MLKYYDEVGVAMWASGIRNLLCENAFGYIWDRQRVENELLFISLFVKRLQDQYLQNWKERNAESSKLITYKGFKVMYDHEQYLNRLNVRKFRRALAAFRVSAHDLEIKHGRYIHVNRGERLCKMCENYVEDEFHFIFVCKAYMTYEKYIFQ